MANANLTSAKKAKNDEFYTQYPDIEKEISAYLMYNPDTFRDKVVYCNCDDPFESNFFKYFVLNFKRLGLKKLITTSYKPSQVANVQVGLFGDDKTLIPDKGRPKITANKFIITEVGDYDNDGQFNLEDVARQLKENKNNEWAPLTGNGDFRSAECVELLKLSDIVVTNPPFSLFREYVNQLFEHRKRVLIIGNINAITYKEIFPLIKENKLWLGPSITSGDREFEVPEKVVDMTKFTGEIREGKYFQKVMGVRWYTNLDHGRRHQKLSLMTMEDNKKFNKKAIKNQALYSKYDNYDAIEVPFTDAIPSNFDGTMGVPISFLDKYNPDQFIVLGMCENEDLYNLKTKSYTNLEKKRAYEAKFGKPGQYDLNASGVVLLNGLLEKVYQRILIKHKKANT